MSSKDVAFLATIATCFVLLFVMIWRAEGQNRAFEFLGGIVLAAALVGLVFAFWAWVAGVVS